MSLGVLSCALGLLCFIGWRKKVAGNTKDLGDNVTMDDELEKEIGARRSQTTFAEGGKLERELRIKVQLSQLTFITLT